TSIRPGRRCWPGSASPSVRRRSPPPPGGWPGCGTGCRRQRRLAGRGVPGRLGRVPNLTHAEEGTSGETARGAAQATGDEYSAGAEITRELGTERPAGDETEDETDNDADRGATLGPHRVEMFNFVGLNAAI